MKKIILLVFLASISNIFALDRLVNPTLSSGNGTTIFTTLTSAINAAINGDNIIVVSSTYNEPALTITKSLKIAPQTPNTTINFSANINITGFSGMNLELIGINLGIYSFTANAPTSGSSTSRSKVTFISCSSTNIDFNQNYYNLNLVKSNVSSNLTFRFGKITSNTLGNLYLNDEPATNLTTTERIFIAANTISNETQLLNDDYLYYFSNNSLKNLRVQKWVLDVNKTNYITNNEFANNCQLHFAVLLQTITLTCGAGCIPDNVFPINSYNFKFDNNIFNGVVYYTNKGNSFVSPLSNYPAFRYGSDYYSVLQSQPGAVILSTTQSQFPNPNSSGFFSWTYNGNIIPCTVPSSGQALTLTRIAGPTNTVDGGNPNHEYYDIDLTINDRGKTGGPYTINNYSTTNNLGFSYVNDLVMPTDLFPSNQVNVLASGYHANKGSNSTSFFDLSNAEFFFGVMDPGQGSGSPIVSEDNQFDGSFERVLRNQLTWSVTTSPTLFNIRFKDADNNWGPVFKKTVFPYGTYPNAQLILQGDSLKVCPNSNVTLTYNGPNGYTPTWFNGVTDSIITFSASSIGYYLVSATLGNSTYVDSIYIGYLPTPSPTISPSGSILICGSSNITLSTVNTSGNTFQWYLNNNPISGATNPNYLPSQAGNYYVVATSTSNGCKGSSATTTLFTNATITPNGTISSCTSPVTLSAPIGPGNLYQWKNNGVSISGATSSTYNATISGNYSVTITNSACNSTSVATIVTINASPTITTSGLTTICSGDAVTLTSSSVSGNTWSNGATTSSITVNQSGAYSVTVSNGSCTATSAPIIVTVNPPITPSFSQVSAICSGEGFTLPSTSNNNISGSWSPAINNSTTTTYTFSPSAGQCANITSMSVTVNPTPTNPVITPIGSTTFCQGDSVLLISSYNSGNIWSNGYTSSSIYVLQSGLYSVQYTDNNGCSSSSATITITTLPNPQVIIATSGPTTICEGENVILTSSPGSNYFWSNGSTTQSITVNQSGTYSVLTSVSNGCSAQSLPVQVVVNSNSSSTITTNAIDSYNLNGQTFTQSGTYTQVVANALGCDSTITLNLSLSFSGLNELLSFVKVYPNPTSGKIFIECDFSQQTKFIILDAIGKEVFNGTINSGVNSIDLDNLTRGTYNLLIDKNNIPIRIIKN